MNIPARVQPAIPTPGATVLRLVTTGRQHTRRAEDKSPSAHLEKQVAELRLSKMLDKLGVPREGYFRLMTPEIIERHIHNCRRCTRSSCVQLCDAYLDEGRPVKNMRFCPNYPSLIANSPAFYKHGTY